MHGKMRNVWQILSKLFFNISKLISNKYNQLLIDVLTYPSSSSRAHVIHSLQVNIYYPSHYSTPQSGSKYRFRIHTAPPPPDCIFFFISIYHEPTTNMTTTLARPHLVYFLWKTCSIMWQWFSSRGDCSLGTVKKNRGNF